MDDIIEDDDRGDEETRDVHVLKFGVLDRERRGKLVH